MEDILQGSCHCHSVNVSVPASAVRFGFASCHCNNCRLTTSAPFNIWSGLHADKSVQFTINDISTEDPDIDTLVTGYNSSPECKRYFCKTCGCTVFIEYTEVAGRWSGEIHVPTSIFNENSIEAIEKAVSAMNKPRYLHVFVSNRSKALGKFQQWANAPTYGGETGLEEIALEDS